MSEDKKYWIIEQEEFKYYLDIMLLRSQSLFTEEELSEQEAKIRRHIRELESGYDPVKALRDELDYWKQAYRRLAKKRD